MTVGIRHGVIVLEGTCTSGEAEELVQYLLSDTAANVDWRTCDAAHTAVVQVLLAAGRTILGPPRGAILKSFIAPALSSGKE